MGVYIQSDNPDKVAGILEKYPEAKRVPEPAAFSEIPSDQALVCVVDNGLFHAAAVCYDAKEFMVFSDPEDARPKTWLTLPRTTVLEMQEITGKHWLRGIWV